MITVAAILPVYNVKQYLIRCLESVLNQTRPFDSIIIVNDGSTDGSQDICAEYAKKHKKVQLINKKNGGLVSAWMEGLKHVDASSHICFIDSDDYIASDYLETLINGLDHSIDLVCMNATQAFDSGELREFRVNGLAEGIYDIDDSFKSRMLSDEGSFIRPIASCRWAKLIKSELVLEYAKYCTEKISYGEDQQLTLGILLGSKKIRVLDEYKYYYQYNTSSIVHTYKKDLWNKIELLMKTISEIPGMSEIPDYQKQFNTQTLLYFADCLRNESYNKSLTKSNYERLLLSPIVQNALSDYFDENLRKIDKIIIRNAEKNNYALTFLYLEMYKLIYKIRGIPG